MAETISYRLLLVEDSLGDARLISDSLADVTDYSVSIEVAVGLSDALSRLSVREFDGVIFDFTSSETFEIEPIAQLRVAAPVVPVIVFVDLPAGGDLHRTAAELGVQFIGKNEVPTHFLAQGLHWIVQQKRAEALHHQFERLLSAMPDAVIVTNRFGVVLFVNEPAHRLFARRREDFVGELIGFAVQEGAVSEIDVHRGAERRTCEMRVVECEWNAAPAFLAIIRDVTEQKRLREQLRHSQKMEAVGLMAGGIAHDFNNLLQVMLLYGEMLRDDCAPSNPHAPLIVEILQSIARAQAMTGQLLAFSRKQPVESAVISPADVVTGFHSMLRRALPTNVEITTLCPDETWPVRIDQGQFEQVLMNLAVNARDAMPSGGRFSIVIDNRHITDRDHGVPPGDYVALCVGDTGSGIEPEHLDRIFDPFFTTKELGRGTGLGLSTCYGIIGQANGLLSAANKDEGGTEFLILLPRTHQPAESDVSLPRETAHLHGRETILVIEDDQAVMRATIATLKKGGYDVLTAANGEEGRRLLQRQADQIDLVLSDVVMPQLGGPELAGLLAESLPQMPLVFMTGYSDYPVATENGDHRIADHRAIMKPFGPGELLATIREVLDSNDAQCAHG